MRRFRFSTSTITAIFLVAVICILQNITTAHAVVSYINQFDYDTDIIVAQVLEPLHGDIHRLRVLKSYWGSSYNNIYLENIETKDVFDAYEQQQPFLIKHRIYLLTLDKFEQDGEIHHRIRRGFTPLLLKDKMLWGSLWNPDLDYIQYHRFQTKIDRTRLSKSIESKILVSKDSQTIAVLGYLDKETCTVELQKLSDNHENIDIESLCLRTSFIKPIPFEMFDRWLQELFRIRFNKQGKPLTVSCNYDNIDSNDSIMNWQTCLDDRIAYASNNIISNSSLSNELFLHMSLNKSIDLEALSLLICSNEGDACVGDPSIAVIALEIMKNELLQYPDKYEKEEVKQVLMFALKHASTTVQKYALKIISFLKIEEAIPQIIEILQRNNLDSISIEPVESDLLPDRFVNLYHAASNTLLDIDTRESLAVLEKNFCDIATIAYQRQQENVLCANVLKKCSEGDDYCLKRAEKICEKNSSCEFSSLQAAILAVVRERTTASFDIYLAESIAYLDSYGSTGVAGYFEDLNNPNGDNSTELLLIDKYNNSEDANVRLEIVKLLTLPKYLANSKSFLFDKALHDSDINVRNFVEQSVIQLCGYETIEMFIEYYFDSYKNGYAMKNNETYKDSIFRCISQSLDNFVKDFIEQKSEIAKEDILNSIFIFSANKKQADKLCREIESSDNCKSRCKFGEIRCNDSQKQLERCWLDREKNLRWMQYFECGYYGCDVMPKSELCSFTRDDIYEPDEIINQCECSNSDDTDNCVYEIDEIFVCRQCEPDTTYVPECIDNKITSCSSNTGYQKMFNKCANGKCVDDTEGGCYCAHE